MSHRWRFEDLLILATLCLSSLPLRNFILFSWLVMSQPSLQTLLVTASSHRVCCPDRLSSTTSPACTTRYLLDTTLTLATKILSIDGKLRLIVFRFASHQSLKKADEFCSWSIFWGLPPYCWTTPLIIGHNIVEILPVREWLGLPNFE